MFSKLFRPRWQHENPQTRKAAIEKLSPAEHAILEQVALHDTDSSVRQMAIAKIDDLPMLERIISKTNPGPEHEFATRCWALKLLNSPKLSLIEIEQQIISCTNEKLLAGIIGNTDNDNLRELALAGITSEEKLLSLMNHSKNGRVWQIIIAKLVSENSLWEALHIVKDRDKRSQQLAKGKLDAIKSAIASQQALEEQARRLLKKLEQLQKTAEDPMFEGILLAAKKQWAALSVQFESELSVKITQALEKCEQQLADSIQKKAEDTKAKEEKKQHSAAIVFLLQQLASLINDAMNNNIPSELLPERLDALSTEWDRMVHTADANARSSFDKNRRAIQRLIEVNGIIADNSLVVSLTAGQIKNLSFKEIEESIATLRKIQHAIDWPAHEQKPASLIAIDELLHTTLSQKKKHEEHTKALSADIKQWLSAIEQHIARKELEPAKKQHKKVRSALAGLPDGIAEKFAVTFQRLGQAIFELEDWKDFATDPKREFLCREMQKLVHAEIPPLHKAESIKQLQTEWKALGHCHDQSLWQEFKQHADEAYIPCQRYFDEQKQLREFNAHQKTIICEQLEHFISQQSWENSDWKAIEKLHKAIQEEWQRFSPVEHHHHKPLQDRYFTALDIIKEKLELERQRNITKLKALVGKAGQLQNLDNIQDAIEEYNHIHEQWKLVGITPRKEQQEQWHTLKLIGDSLYAKRQNLRQEADAQRQKKLDRAEEINRRILQLSTLPDNEPSASKAEFQQLCEAFSALDAMPRHSIAGHQKACQTYEDAIRNINWRNWLRQFDQLEVLANEWKKAEIAGKTVLFDDYSEEIPEKWKKVLQHRFSTPISADAEKDARRLCIELEILCGAETPKEDSDLKMELQMAKLAERFSAHPTATFEEKLEGLYLRWFAQPCWDNTMHTALNNRFLSTARRVLEQGN